MSQLLKVGSVVLAMGTASVLLVGCSNANTTENSVQTTTNSSSSDSSTTDNDVQTDTTNSAMNADAENEMNGQNNNSDNTTNSDQTDSTAANSEDISPVTNGVSQQIDGNSQAADSLNELLPKITYSTKELSDTAKKVNQATWTAGSKIDRLRCCFLFESITQHHGNR